MNSERKRSVLAPPPFWIRFNVHNSHSSAGHFIAQIDYPMLDEVTFYALHSTGQLDTLKIGDAQSFHPRHVDHPSMLYRFKLAPDERITFYASVQTKGSMILPVKVWDEKRFFEVAGNEQKIHFFFYGCMIAIGLINLAVFFTLRESLYFHYAMAIFGYVLFFTTMRGYAHQMLFPDFPAANSRAFLMSMPFLSLFSLFFARKFLATPIYSPNIDTIIKGMLGIEVAFLALFVFMDYNLAVQLSAFGAVLSFAVLLVAGPLTWYRGNRAGGFFTVAWIPLTIGVFATSGRTAGFLPNDFWVEYSMQIGSGLEALILTLALADRLYREREEKISAQAESLRIEKQRNATQNQLAQAMTRDPVTQLPNRNRFEWLLRSTLLERPGSRFIVGISRITRADEITRTLGFSASERVIRNVAQKMNMKTARLPGVVTSVNSQGQVEAVFQLAEHTFGILLDQAVSEKNIEQYQETIKKLAEPVEMDSLNIDLQPNFGCALYPAHGTDPSQLIRNAHVGMEHADHAPDQVGIYNESLDTYSESRLSLMSDLREALRSNQTELHYQPKFCISKNEVVGLEALIRWTHPTLGFVPPDQFIPFAEETGVIHDLTRWAFERAVSDLVLLREHGYNGSIAINISARDLINPDLRNQFADILTKFSVPPDAIYLELTETATMQDPERGIEALQSLADLGLKIAIDDFGKGYSSLSYLKKMPATEIKLDRSLITDLCSNESARTIVKTSIDMIHSLGYDLVAEGVEDEQTYDVLRAVKCDHIQGFWYSRPMPLTNLQQWLRQNSQKSQAN